MTIRIAINGFGRIGRNVVRALYESGRRAEITVVAINELADAAGIAHLLKYDTSHGRFAWDVRQEREQLFVGDDAIRLLHEPTIAALPWRELAVDEKSALFPPRRQRPRRDGGVRRKSG